MRLVLDTHAYFWWVKGRRELSVAAVRAIEEPDREIFISAVVPWELATKSRLGKWPGADGVLEDLADAMRDSGFHRLPISLEHARLAGSIQSPHKDPFDRMLAAQATVDDLVVVTADPAFRMLRCRTLW